MSTTVDSRVVEMRFDNKQFESGVATTMSTLEKFKQKLNLDGATKGLENVDAAAKRVNLSGLGTAVENVGLKFNAMYTIADQALRNITNSAVNAGKRIAASLTIEPIKTGLQEYETQINAVQTILANTESKGTTLKDVNGALDELNTYADKTIYNFTEMTRNIGTFTAAGVDLDTSVNAIQGIANLAAVSGSNSQQASTAMYQLSQAMAAGTVKLMDWNSVVNAGMGGQVFQDALKETSRAMADRAKSLKKMSDAEIKAYQQTHGYSDEQIEAMKEYNFNIDKLIDKKGSFRETLSEGWITTDILTETLSHFTMAAKEGSEQWNEYKKSLMDQGYSEEQANAILKMSNTATDAATKVKTATQLFDTLKETAQSGWTQTWELIFGDFEEAKNLFSMLYETLSPIIEASSKARNDILEGWSKAGGREDLIWSLKNVFKAIGSIVKPIKEAFNDIFPASLNDKVKGLVNFTEGLRKFTAKLTLSTKASENLKRTFTGLFAILDIVKKVFGAVIKAISPLFGKVDDLGGGILGVTASIGDWLVGLNESIEASGFFTKAVDKIHAAFEKVKNFIQPVIDAVKEFANELGTNLTSSASNAETRLGPLSALGKFITAVFTGIGNIVKKVFPFVAAAASAIGNVLGDLMNRISDSIQNANYDSLFDFTSGGIIAAIGVFIAKFMKSGADLLDNAGGIIENIKGIFGGLKDAANALTESVKADTLKKIATAIGILAVSLLVLSLIPSEKLTEALFSITTLFGELMGSMAIFSKLGDMKGIVKTAGALVALASAVLVLSIALKIMSTMSWAEMGVGLISLTVGLGELVGAVWLLSMLPEKELKSSTKAIKTLASSLLILSVALKIMSTMSWEGMGVALISMTVGLGALVGAIWLLPQDTALRAAGLIGLATAMVILGAALKIMATMSGGELAVSLAALAGSLAIIAVAMNLMIAAIPGALAMLIVAPALVVLAGALKILATMSWEEIGRGLVALAGSLLILAIGLTAMVVAMPGAAALLVAAAALAVLAPVLMLLGSMSLAEIGKGLLAIAGVFVVLGLAAFILQPLVPTIFALAGSIALLGVACLAAGAGILMIGVGITAIATAVATSGGAITLFVASIIGLIPFLIEQIGLGIIKLCEVISGSAAAICEAVKVIILAVVDALVTAVPPLVEGLLVLITSLLDSLISHLPTIVSKLVTLVVQLLTLLTTYVPVLMEPIFSLLVAIINSITANISRIVVPLVNLVVTIFQGLADAVAPIINDIIIPILNTFKDIIVEVCDAVGGVLEDLGGVFDSVFNGISEVVDSVGESIRNVLDGIAGIIDSIGEAALNAGTGFENLAKGVKIITDLKLTDMAASLAAVAAGIGDIAKHADEMDDIGNGMKNLGKALVTSMIDGIDSQLGKVDNAAKNVVKQFADSVKANQDKVDAACKKLVTSGSDAISDKASSFESAGKDLGSGLVKGINAKQTAVYDAAYALGQKAVQGEKDGQKSNSPSKLTIQAGKWLGEGLIVGMEQMGKKVYKAGSVLGEGATKTLSYAISRISDVINSDIDAQPTIRPVIDLTGVRSGVNAISGMLNLDSSVGVRTNISAISSMMAARGQNGGTADVVSAINKLNKKMDNMGNTTNNIVNGVTYDNGSQINDAVATLVRYAKIGERV